MLKIRTGIGYDIHPLVPGKGLMVGGIKVSENMSFKAHSDGDILIHSLIDALLGAIGDNDIGELFPDTDDRYRDISSSLLLEQVGDILKKKRIEIMNVDSVIIAENIKINIHKEQIRKHISSILSIPSENVNVKGKTKEKMDAAGRGECMECYCVVLVRCLS